MASLAAGGVCNLVVVFNEVDHGPTGKTQHGCAAPLLLPRIVLPLEQITVLSCRHKLLRSTAVIGVVSIRLSGQSDVRCVMVVVIPQSVKAIATFANRLQQDGV